MPLVYELLRNVSLSSGLFLALFASCSPQPAPPVKKIVRGEVVQSYPHDADAFTQGLVFQNGVLYEGTGQNGRSTLRKVSLDDGKVHLIVNLDARYFGEGITILGDRIFQLTWKENTCFVYYLKSMEYQKSFSYLFEGWGLTDNEEELIASDGTAVIRFLDPQTFRETRKVIVKDRGQPVRKLNELEWVDGEIWANVWYEDQIVRISPKNGEVLGWIDVSHIYPKKNRDVEAVMNGIAYDPESKRIFITGKNWPKLYEIKVPK